MGEFVMINPLFLNHAEFYNRWRGEKMVALESSTIIILSSIGVIIGIIAGIILSKTNKELVDRIDKAELEAASQPEKTKPAWDLARATLDSYFNRNLTQLRFIFVLSVTVMLVGFAFIATGTALAFQSPDSGLSVTVIGVAGVITEMIGATFLFMYQATMKEAATYTETLERINSVGMAMQILDTIPDNSKEDDLKNVTKATVVKMLMSQGHHILQEVSTDG